MKRTEMMGVKLGIAFFTGIVGLMWLAPVGTVTAVLAADEVAVMDVERVRSRLAGDEQSAMQARYTGNLVLLVDPAALDMVVEAFELHVEHADERAGLAIVSMESGVDGEAMMQALAEHDSVKAVRLETNHAQRHVFY
jgi:hypothetical protein